MNTYEYNKRKDLRDRQVSKWSMIKYCCKRMSTLEFARNAVTASISKHTYPGWARRKKENPIKIQTVDQHHAH